MVLAMRKIKMMVRSSPVWCRLAGLTRKTKAMLRSSPSSLVPVLLASLFFASQPVGKEHQALRGTGLYIG